MAKSSCFGSALLLAASFQTAACAETPAPVAPANPPAEISLTTVEQDGALRDRGSVGSRIWTQANKDSVSVMSGKTGGMIPGKFKTALLSADTKMELDCGGDKPFKKQVWQLMVIGGGIDNDSAHERFPAVNYFDADAGKYVTVQGARSCTAETLKP